MSRGGAKNRALKKPDKIDPSDVHPKLAEGLTQGIPADEALAHFKPKHIAPLEQRLAHMHEQSDVRAPRPRFHAENKSTGLVRESMGRRMADTEIVFPPDVLRAIKAGMICLRCLEPQPSSFADEHLEGCEGVLVRGPHYMRDWQIIDLAMEMEGEKHLGPSKPMNEYLDSQDERVEKRQFIRKILSGHSGRIPKEWLRDATLLEDLTPDERLMLGAR